VRRHRAQVLQAGVTIRREPGTPRQLTSIVILALGARTHALGAAARHQDDLDRSTMPVTLSQAWMLAREHDDLWWAAASPPLEAPKAARALCRGDGRRLRWRRRRRCSISSSSERARRAAC